MSTITHQDMAQLVATGEATQWTQPLGGAVPLAARVGDTWYVVHDTTANAVGEGGDGSATDAYQPAPEPLAAVLDRMSTVLDLADAAVAAADRSSRNGSSTAPGTERL